MVLWEHFVGTEPPMTTDVKISFGSSRGSQVMSLIYILKLHTRTRNIQYFHHCRLAVFPDSWNCSYIRNFYFRYRFNCLPLPNNKIAYGLWVYFRHCFWSYWGNTVNTHLHFTLHSFTLPLVSNHHYHSVSGVPPSKNKVADYKWLNILPLVQCKETRQINDWNMFDFTHFLYSFFCVFPHLNPIVNKIIT